MKPVQAGARGGWRLIGRVRWSPWPGGRRGRSSRARRSSATDPERVGGGSADPIGFRFWRSGRIVPPRTPPHRRRNRGIMRKSLSASGVPARTILPERHIPPRAGSAGAFSASSGRATPVEAPAAAMLRAAPGAPDRRPPPPRSGVSTGREDRAGKGGWRITFGCVGGAAHPGNGVIAPLRDGRGAGRRVKDMRRPPF